ncbi:MAG TPA: PD-(D/E)XK nuclease family protein [Candidatus Wallbacteria bacterium]|nr:PD-(D/E)XK nuclease family protein [Candidatus Wallbacteria bacterium]
MHINKYIDIICSDKPVPAFSHILKRFPGREMSALVLSSSQFRADRFASTASAKRDGKIPSGLKCMSFNAFIESYAASDFETSGIYINYEQKSALILKTLAQNRREFTIDNALIENLNEAIGEFKSNKIDIGRVLKNMPPGKSLSYKCNRFLELYNHYEKILLKNHFIDYHDCVKNLFGSRDFYEHIKNSYDLIIFDGLERLSPIETDLFAVALAAARNAAVINEKTFCGISPQKLAFEQAVERCRAMGVEITAEKITVEEERTRPAVKFETLEGSLKTTAVEKGYISVIECGDLAGEAELIARTIRALNLNRGARLCTIAVFMPAFTGSRKFMETAFSRYGLRFQTNEGKKASEFSIIRKLQSALAFLINPDSDTFMTLFNNSAFAGFAALKKIKSSTRIMKNILSITRILEPGMEFSEETAEALLQCELESRQGQATLIKELYGMLKKFTSSAAAITGSVNNSLAECYERFAAFLKAAEFVTGSPEENELFNFVMEKVRGKCSQAAAAGVNEKLSVKEGLTLLRGFIDRLFVPSAFDSEKLEEGLFDAVIIHSKPNINLFEYDYLFIAGAVEGSFPRHGRENSFFFDPADRELLGFHRQISQTRSDSSLFHQLAASASKGVFISAPRGQLGRKFIRSRFFDEIENAAVYEENNEALSYNDIVESAGSQGISAWPAPAPDAAGLRGKRYEKLMRDIREAQFSKIISAERLSTLKSENILDCSKIDPEKLLAHLGGSGGPLRVSPTALETFYFCPARYFFEKCLGLKAETPYSGELDPLEEGRIIHDALEKFFSAAAVKKALKYYYESGAEEREAQRGDIERLLFDAGCSAMAAGGLEKKFGKAYREIKMLQYFNALSGYERSETKAGIIGGIKGFFKNFLDDYLEFLTRQDFFLSPAAAEYGLKEELTAAGRQVLLSAKCDRIDACVLNEADGPALYFVITDYKTGATPTASEIRAFKKIQAPFYLYFFEKKFNESIKASGEVFGEKAKAAIGACFIYTSISKLNKDLKPEKSFFISSSFNAGGGKKKKAGADVQDERSPETEKQAARPFGLKAGRRANPDFRRLIDETPAVIENFIQKTAGGDFHASLLENHSCEFCEFNQVCHRNPRAAAEEAARLRKAGGEITNRRCI